MVTNVVYKWGFCFLAMYSIRKIARYGINSVGSGVGL